MLDNFRVWSSVFAVLLLLGCSEAGPAANDESGDQDVVSPDDSNENTESTSSDTGEATPDASAPDTVETDTDENKEADADVEESDIAEEDIEEDATEEDTTSTEGGSGGSGGESIEPDIIVEPDTDEPVEDKIFESAELNLTIIGPGAKDTVQSLGAYISVSGILFGEAETITWIHVESGTEGEAEPGAYWQTDGIQLSPGDNTIEVTATALDGEVSSDTVTLLYNPAFLFGGAPVARPSMTLTGANTKHVLTIPIAYLNMVEGSVHLWELDEAGEPSLDLGEMKDNGNLVTNCDEVEGDGIFSRCITLNEADPIDKKYRVSVSAVNVFETYQALSPPLTISVYEPYAQATCEANLAVLQAAKDAHAASIEAGESYNAAQVAALNSLLADASVTEAGVAADGYGVWARFTGGVLGGIPLSPDNLRGSGNGLETSTEAANVAPVTLASKEATILAPANDALGDLDEGPWVTETLEDLGCPYFAVNQFKNQFADLYRMRNMFGSGVISFSGHGDTLFGDISAEARAAYDWEHNGSQEILWAGEQVDCGKFLSTMPSCSGDGSACQDGAGECVVGSNSYCVDFKQADLREGRMIIGTNGYGVLPDFLKHYGEQRKVLPNSLVFLGACRTMYNGSLTSVLFGLGARAIIGFSDYVTSSFVNETAQGFYSTLLNSEELSGLAFESLATKEDPETGAQARLFGATNLSTADFNIVNPSFESSDTTGWTKDGDGRVIAALGATIPVEGKYMGLLSTGLGFTQEVGQLQQKFCLESDVSEVSFFWKFYSEEFLEYCGSIYQDAFKATVKNTENQVTILDVTVDDVCPPGQCLGCGDAATEYNITLIPSDVSFDQGDVYQGDWVKSSANVSVLAGTENGPVTFTYFTSDTGDSIYDTVILVDKLLFE